MGVLKMDAYYPQTCVLAKNGTVSAVVTLPNTVSDVRLYAPTLDNATVKLQVSPDGTNYGDAWWPGDDNAPAQWITAAPTGGWAVDVSRLVLPGYKVRIVCGAAQTTAAVTFIFLSR